MRGCISFVQILDGIGESAPELGRYCGYQTPEPVISHSNTITVQLVMEHFYRGKFKLHWEAILPENAPTTGPSTEFPSGPTGETHEIRLNRTGEYILTSPGYPWGYDHNMNVVWIFRTIPSSHFFVNVQDMNIEGNNVSCSFDMLTFSSPLQYGSSQWHANKTICGRFSGSFEVPSNLMRVQFITDGSVNKTGFQVSLSNRCGGIIRESAGVISTEDVAGAYQCEWIIIVREGRTINASFDNFLISDSNNCAYSYMLFRNGGNENSPIIGKYCGSNRPTIRQSASNMLYIRFNGAHRANIVREL